VIYSNCILLLLLFLLNTNHPKNVMSPNKRRFHRDNTEEKDELNRVDNDDHVIPMENDNINNTVDDDGKNRLIQDIYNAPMDDDVNLEEDNLQDDNDDNDEDNDDEYILDKPILQNDTESLYEGTKKCSLYCNVVGQLEGIKWFAKHMYDTDPKVSNIIL
jgi:hypothetical protein